MTNNYGANALAQNMSIEEIVQARDLALKQYEDGLRMIEKSLETAKSIGSNCGFYIKNLPSLAKIRKDIDRKTWRHLFNVSGMAALMNATQKSAFEEQIEKEVPEISIETIKATLVTQFTCKDTTFIEGMIDTFSHLDSAYKSHDAFKINKKIILKDVEYTSRHHSASLSPKNMITDLERIVCIINKQVPPTPSNSLVSQLNKVLGQSASLVFGLFKCKTFINGNVHIEITCKGTVDKINELIAGHYGASLASGH